MSEEIYQVEIPELNIGRTLKRFRENAGYTMDVFAGMMGWTKSTVSKVEKGTRAISTDELYRAATILSVPIANFYPEVITGDWGDDIPTISAFADEVREISNDLIESEGKVTPDIEEKATSVFLRNMPQTIYRVLNVTPNQVSIKGTLMRGPHFIPRIEIHYTGRKGYNINWFYIVISFKENLKHIYMSLVQETDVKYRADFEPTDQYEQLEALKESCLGIIDKVNATNNVELDWDIYEDFFDDYGTLPENGSIVTRGYVPVIPPDAYDVTVNEMVYPDMSRFVIKNFDGRKAITGEKIPELIVDTTHKDQELHENEFELMDSMDRDIVNMFLWLSRLIRNVEKGGFIRWKKEVLSARLDKEGCGEDINSKIESVLIIGNDGLFRRNRQKVLQDHDFTCEINKEHKSFTEKVSGKPYMEVHHLIPLYAQDKFKTDLNCEANMICVCPVCNRRLAYGLNAEKEDMIVPLYYSRREALKEAGIDISLKQLLDIYDR